MRCEQFIHRLEEPSLQEGGPWPQDLICHARDCARCAEILAIFQAIPSEVSTMERDRSDGSPSAVVISVHAAVPLAAAYRRRRVMRRVAAAALITLALLLPWHLADLGAGAGGPAGPGETAFDGLASSSSVDEGIPADRDVIEQPTARVETPRKPAVVALAVRVTAPASGDAGAGQQGSGRAGVASGETAQMLDVVESAPLVLAPVTREVASPRQRLIEDFTAAPSTDDALADSAAHDTSAPAAEALDESAAAGDESLLLTELVSVARRAPEGPRIRVAQGVQLLTEDWADAPGYGGEVGLRQRIWFHPHVGMTLDTGVRYGVNSGFDALPDNRTRGSTAGTVAGTGSMMVAVAARPAVVGLGVGLAAGQWDPGTNACTHLDREVPQRDSACEEWSYVAPDLVASLEFDVNQSMSLGVRWTGHDQGFEMDRSTGDAEDSMWINRVTLEATFIPGVGGERPVFARARQSADEAGGRSRRALGVTTP
jgi:hypothetical protein